MLRKERKMKVPLKLGNTSEVDIFAGLAISCELNITLPLHSGDTRTGACSVIKVSSRIGLSSLFRALWSLFGSL